MRRTPAARGTASLAARQRRPGFRRALAGPGLCHGGEALPAGHFTWKEWAATLAAELKAAADRGEPDDGSRYYEYWLAALERLVTAKGLSDPAALLAQRGLG